MIFIPCTKLEKSAGAQPRLSNKGAFGEEVTSKADDSIDRLRLSDGDKGEGVINNEKFEDVICEWTPGEIQNLNYFRLITPLVYEDAAAAYERASKRAIFLLITHAIRP